MIDGATRLYGIIGDPIAQAKSPALFTERFRKLGVNAVLVPLHIRGEHFDEALRGLKALANLDGLIATIPYKSRMLDAADRVLATGQRVGAINAMRRESDGRWTGDMFDGKGLVAALRARSVSPTGKRVMLLGAGGAGAAIADAIAEGGAQSITLFDTDRAKADTLCARVVGNHPACTCAVADPGTGSYDVLINATPVGMSPLDGLPAKFPSLPAHLFVVDIVPARHETALISLARSSGCGTMSAAAMVQGQVDEMLLFFRVL